jgi:hypothetical protein
MNTKQIKIAGITLFIASIVILAGIIAFNGIEADEGNIPPGVENITTVQLSSVSEGTKDIPEITLETTMAAPEIMMVYKVNRGIPRQEFTDMAENLEINGEIEENLRSLMIKGDPYKIRVGIESGVITYDNTTQQPGYDEDYLNKYLPSDEEARKIADNFLDSHNIRPKDAEFYNVTHDIGYFISGDGQVEVKNSDVINVWYIRDIDDYQVLTDKMYVQIDVHGTIQHMFIEWNGYEPYREYPVISPEEATEYLKKTGLVIRGEVKNPVKANVTKISIGYIAETQSMRLPYLIPVYVLEGVVQGEEGTSGSFYQWIPATPEFAAEIT